VNFGDRLLNAEEISRRNFNKRFFLAKLKPAPE
jgi:hypothetical protein